MRAADNRTIEWVDDEAVVLDPETGELHYLNAPAALIFGLILEHGFEGAMEQARTMFSGEPAFEKDLPGLLEDMVERGLLVDG